MKDRGSESKNKCLVYIKRLLLVLFSLLFVVSLVNFLIDPFNTFNVIKAKGFNYYKPEIKRQERLTKVVNLKLERHLDTIFVGSSRVSWTLSPTYYNKITGKKASNMGFVGCFFNELKTNVYKAIKTHPEIKTVVIAIEMDKNRFAPIQEEAPLDIKSFSKTLTMTELSSVLFSFDTTFSSISTLSRNLSSTNKKRYDCDGMKIPYLNYGIKAEFDEKTIASKDAGKNLTKENIDFFLLKKLINDLKQKGVEVVLYLPPLHASYFEIIDINKSLDGIDLFKTELAKVQPFYDFAYMHPINLEPQAPDMKYYFDPLHATYFAGEKVLDKIFLNKGNFGVLVNSKNVYAHNERTRKEFRKWQSQNPDVRKYVKELCTR